jgi:MFS superfamily sulfate permease-like transporter
MAESESKGLKLQGFSTKGIAGDLSAGLTKSIDSVTGGMAKAVLAGVNPVDGLYTVLAATPIGALFTSSVYMNIDSTGALAATVADPVRFLLWLPADEREKVIDLLRAIQDRNWHEVWPERIIVGDAQALAYVT